MAHRVGGKLDPSSSTPDKRPWHHEPWPWVIIGLLGATVVAGLVTLWIAATHPDQRVVDAVEYDRIQSELKAQTQDEEAKSESPPDPDEGS